MSIEDRFDVSFVARLTSEEKQIQQNYRPVIGVHKWFARRCGSLFRSLILSEFGNGDPLRESYFKGHDLRRIIVADPFMGGGTTLFEANRLGCNVVGCDINPMSYWIVRQELVPVDRKVFREAAEEVLEDVGKAIDDLYTTECLECGHDVPVKYFFWVKQQCCESCEEDLDLFPGFLIAENVRHPNFVLHCPHCERLVELAKLPEKGRPARCPSCSKSFDWRGGNASRNRYNCPKCDHQGKYPAELRIYGPPRHRLFGMEYYCESCRTGRKGRFFKSPDTKDLQKVALSAKRLKAARGLVFPMEEIPDGDETKRLHRWGYSRYTEMFNDRQLLALGLLMKRIGKVDDIEARHALATVFSDSLRYQNMLCRYDTYALKCQDIFAVHGFPVGLVQCENNVLGIPGVGSGSFAHFVEKYDRAKAYCEEPFETIKGKGKKQIVATPDEKISATLVDRPALLKGSRQALLSTGSIEDLKFNQEAFDAVFTDPPYFDNVQYAELMDFCFGWLRLLLGHEIPEFEALNTRSLRELTGNATTGKDLAHFTAGLAAVYARTAKYLKPDAPFVFTYHHNSIAAYVPVAVAVLDAGLVCTQTLPCPSEMSASLHISGTKSSVVDSIFVCRKQAACNVRGSKPALKEWLEKDRKDLEAAGLRCTKGDLTCLGFGHIARCVIDALRSEWNAGRKVSVKMNIVEESLLGKMGELRLTDCVRAILDDSFFPGEVLEASRGY